MVAHTIALRSFKYAFDGGVQSTRTPVIVDTISDNFVAAFLADLMTQSGRNRLALSTIGGADIELFQPVHRHFYLLVVDAACVMFADPDLDPRLDIGEIESMGMVVRREIPGGGRERWVRQDGRIIGWRAMRAGQEDIDPDAVRRPKPLERVSPLVSARLATKLAAPDDQWEEAVTRLYRAPPDVCAATGKTVLFGLIPVTSPESVDQERQEGVLTEAIASYSDEDVQAVLPPHFQATSGVALGTIADRTFDSRYGNPVVATVPEYTGTFARDLDSFLGLLRLTTVTLGAFEDPKDTAIKDALDAIQLPFADGSTQPAGATLKSYADVLVFGGGGSVEMPSAWPKVTDDQAAAIAAAAKTKLNGRVVTMVKGERRFDARNAQYRARAFVRVKRDDGCPPKLVWSDYSDVYKIAAWFKSSDVAPVPIPLPSLSDLGLSSFKPNATFIVPGDIAQVVNNSSDDMLKGQGKGAKPPLIDWICGFNIPIITLCAFIVLNLFLSLFNIIFFWMAFIKICIPIPSSLKSKLPPGSTTS